MKLTLIIIILSGTTIFAQTNNKSPLDIKEIMKGRDFIGYWPENVAWHIGGQSILFDWNPENELEMSRYSYSLASKNITKLDENIVAEGVEIDMGQLNYATQFFIQEGNLWSYNKANKSCRELIATENRISNLQRVANANKIVFQQGDNLFLFDTNLGTLKQLTYFKVGKAPDKKEIINELNNQQEELFKYIQDEKRLENYRDKKKIDPTNDKSIYLDKKKIDFLVISKDEKYIYVRFGEYPENKNTTMLHHISEDGYSYTTNERPKVGENEPKHTFGIIDLKNDSLMIMDFDKLTNIRKKPDYLKEYGDTILSYPENRKIIMHRPIQSIDGKVVMDIRSYDNKDRWIVQVDSEKSSFNEIDNQHDEAWIGGPGISSWNMSIATIGFYSKKNKLYFQSEKTGYSHLYSYDFESKNSEQLTNGQFEVYDVKTSKDLTQFYLTLNKTHPGDRGLYKFDPLSKRLTPILEKTGAFEAMQSPNEKYLAFLFSDKTNPWELFICDNEPKSIPTQITKSQRPAYQNYSWTIPEVISFKGKDDVNVYARLYKSMETNNKPAVIFVHGAGYLQNAHNYWSNYYREFMFHNLLKDNGFTVLDIDYRASEGYGRDFRTAIYRHMGGMDLEDQVSGKKYLVDNLKVNPNKVGIYGGSYGGFITLMALFTKPNEFACGAALRSVTDWMHYNHEYTSNILNYPNTDSIAYRQSSPIYFAENLSKPLLILHGMVDDNVQFQDVVRLSQRLIELEKSNWELAVFPIEGHGFMKSYSWTDEYRRIFELFNEELKDK